MLNNECDQWLNVFRFCLWVLIIACRWVIFLQNRGIAFSVIDVFYVFDGNLPFSIPLHIPFVQYDGILGLSCHGSHKLFSLLIIALTFHHRVLVLSVPRITSPPSVAWGSTSFGASGALTARTFALRSTSIAARSTPPRCASARTAPTGSTNRTCLAMFVNNTLRNANLSRLISYVWYTCLGSPV